MQDRNDVAAFGLQNRTQSQSRRSGSRWLLACGSALAGCGGSFGETLQRGYVLPEGALEQIPVGATQEQVLIVLGTPSTVATVSGEAFYYISQKTRARGGFHAARGRSISAWSRSISTRIAGSQRLANYGIKDGKVFDFVSQTTPTGGQELSYLRNIFQQLSSPKHASSVDDIANGQAKGPAQRAGPLSFSARRDLQLSAPAPPAATAPRCW